MSNVLDPLGLFDGSACPNLHWKQIPHDCPDFIFRFLFEDLKRYRVETLDSGTQYIIFRCIILEPFTGLGGTVYPCGFLCDLNFPLTAFRYSWPLCPDPVELRSHSDVKCEVHFKRLSKKSLIFLKKLFVGADS